MKGHILVYSGSQCPDTEAVVGLTGVTYISEHFVRGSGLSSLSNQLSGLWGYIEIFLPSGFLLAEY